MKIPTQKCLRAKKMLLLLLMLWLPGVLLMAQNNLTVTGTVTDTNRDPIPGASVIVKGTITGTVTDAEGRFTLPAAANATLVVSFVGMQTREIPIGNRTSIDVSLVSSVSEIEEVVIVAYGTQKKANLTGAVSTVEVDKTLEARPVTEVGRALQGSTPGLIVTTTSGSIGGSPTIKIRGTVSTIGGGSGNPLILVDNVEVPDLSYVNPDDIESISVLKDASTTAIYGARAAFGAVLITTKKGTTDGKTRISYSNNFSWSTPTSVPKHTRADLNLQYSYDQLNAFNETPTWEFGQVGYYYNPDVIAKVKEWIDTYGDGKGLGREMAEGRDFDYRASGGAYYYRPWDIYDIYYKSQTPQVNHNISVRGGTEKNAYNGYLTYQNDFGDHSLKVTGGTNIEDAEYIYLSAKRTGVYDFDKGEVNLAGGDQTANSEHT